MDEFHSYTFALLFELQEICGRRHKTCNTVTIYDSIETQSSQVFSNIVLQMLSPESQAWCSILQGGSIRKQNKYQKRYC